MNYIITINSLNKKPIMSERCLIRKSLSCEIWSAYRDYDRVDNLIIICPKSKIFYGVMFLVLIREPQNSVCSSENSVAPDQCASDKPSDQYLHN